MLWTSVGHDNSGVHAYPYLATLNPPFLLLHLATIALFLHTTTAANVPASHPPVGQYTVIPVDPNVEELTKFNVEEHNRQKNDHVNFKTLSAERQVVSGYNFRLVTTAYPDHQKPDNYEAVVYVPLSRTKRLTSFKNRLQTATTEATATASSSSSASHHRLGEFIPIPNARNNTKVQNLGSFAVHEYSAKFGIDMNLTFSVVEQAEYQIVAGTNYYLYLYAIEKGLSTDVRALFDAYVYEALSSVKTLT